jgi:hypothetical protein
MRKLVVCALALVESSSAFGQPRPAVKKIEKQIERPAKSLADCTTFDQQDKGEAAVDLTIKNSCTIPVDCTVSWRVVCAPKSKRRSEHPGSQKLALVEGTTSSTEASATICGDDAWSIDSIEWSCLPNKE